MRAAFRKKAALVAGLLAGLILGATCADAAGGGVLWLQPGRNYFSLHDHLQFLEDPGGELGLAEVSSPELDRRFRPLSGGGLRLGWTNSTYWLRLTLARRDTANPSAEYIFNLAQTTNVSAVLFAPQAAPGGRAAWREIAPLDRSDRPQDRPSRFSHFILPPLTSQPRTVYLRIRIPLGLDALPEVVTRAGFQRQLMVHTLSIGVMLSVLLILAGVHLAIYYSLRDRAYLWYSLLLFSLSLFLTFISGTMQNLAPTVPLSYEIGFPAFLYGVALLLRALFIRAFLPLKKLFPLGDRLLLGMLFFFLPVIFLPLLGSDAVPWLRFFMACGMLRMAGLLYIGIVCLRRGFKPAALYLVATLPQMLGWLDLLFGSLSLASLLPVSMYDMQQIGVLFEAAVLTLALVRQVKVLREERESIEQQARRDALEHQKRLRGLAAELVRSEERQRRVLAEDLHDGISQNLATSLFNLRLRAGGQAGRAPDAELAGICDLLRVTLEQTRDLTFDISPPVLYDYGLEASLEWLAGRMQERHGLRVDFAADGALPGRNESLEANLFRAAQELLVNVVKHAEAGRAEVLLTCHDHLVSVRVCDDGRGMPGGGPSPNGPDGFGLYSIRERLLAMGGEMEIESAPGQGASVTLRAPWPEPREPRTAERDDDEDHPPAGR